MNEAKKKQILLELSKCNPSDFDGHTDFQSMSARDRLLWLSSTTYFVYQSGAHTPELGCNRYFRPS